MAKPLRLLIVEDQPADAELMLDALRESGFEPEWDRVETEDAYRARLDDRLDLILSDFNLPSFSGLRAVELLRESGLEIPFIIVSGSIGEEVAVAAMKRGAVDYLLKDRLTRLGPAVELALQQNGLRRERRQAMRALRESEERFRQVVENIREVFWIGDPARQVMLYVSPAFEEIWGCSCQSLYKNPRQWLEAVHPEDRERVSAAAAEKQVLGGYDETYRITRPDGQLRWIRARAYPIRNEAGEVYRIVGTAEDVTGRKELEAQLAQMHRMESVGRMAGGIAHDLNNILAPILMGAPLLRIGLPPAQAEKTLTAIESSARRGAELVKQLLMFGRGLEGSRQLVRLKDLVREMEEIMRETFPKNIVIASDLPANVWPLMGDATQLHQVLLNLCVNARDAMPAGGRLGLVARNVEIDENYARMQAATKPGSYACLSVTDTGTGIPPDVIDKIFDPFFTTKPLGEGTGLGLATLIGIVKNHGGFVAVESEVGKGSTFKIYLPAEPGAREAAPAQTAASVPRGSGEMVLVVDDEASICDVIGQTLAQYGYRVLTATDGGDGCAKFARHLAEVKLVLTDLDMPVMGGVVMIQVLRKMNPAIKIIISSGKISDVASTTALQELEVNSVLTKPYTADTVLRLVHELLHG
jgi:PAS domain S-box-containing protein